MMQQRKRELRAIRRRIDAAPDRLEGLEPRTLMSGWVNTFDRAAVVAFSNLLRIPDREARHQAREQFTQDFRLVAKKLKKL